MSKPQRGAGKTPAPKRKSGRSLTEGERVKLGFGTIKLRLPQDALAQLAELADEGEASRAEIVDSLIRLEWAKTPGRKLRSKRDELAADIARG